MSNNEKWKNNVLKKRKIGKIGIGKIGSRNVNVKAKTFFQIPYKKYAVMRHK